MMFKGDREPWPAERSFEQARRQLAIRPRGASATRTAHPSAMLSSSAWIAWERKTRHMRKVLVRHQVRWSMGVKVTRFEVEGVKADA